MTNKRKHQLEQITKLMFDRVKLFNYTGKITLREARFMRWCISTYYGYYHNQILKYFD